MEEREAKVAENFQKWLHKKNQEQNALRVKRAADELELQRQKQLQEQKMQVAIAEWNCAKVLTHKLLIFVFLNYLLCTRFVFLFIC
jgi:hypothetical protein